LHVGTDGGGSIRIPASFAGIYGLKASFGRIPAYPPSGAWSLSHIGPMTRTVADAALMLQVAAGPDERDQTSLPAAPVDYVKALAGGVKGLRVAWSADLGFADDVRAGLVRPARVVGAPAAALREVRPAPHADDRVPAIRDRARQPDGDRGEACAAVRLDPVHVPVQHDRPARGLGAVRLHEGRPARGPADRRPPVRRRHRAARLGGVRARAPLGATPPAA